MIGRIREFWYILEMKYGILVFFFIAVTWESSGQVMFRNDIVLGKHSKRNRGLTFITINLGRRYGADMYGRSGATLIIDVDAIRNPGKSYTYRQLAERVYNVDPIPFPSSPRVPEFLLSEPPVIVPRSMPTVHVWRTRTM